MGGPSNMENNSQGQMSLWLFCRAQPLEDRDLLLSGLASLPPGSSLLDPVPQVWRVYFSKAGEKTLSQFQLSPLDMGQDSSHPSHTPLNVMTIVCPFGTLSLSPRPSPVCGWKWGHPSLGLGCLFFVLRRRFLVVSFHSGCDLLSFFLKCSEQSQYSRGSPSLTGWGR